MEPYPSFYKRMKSLLYFPAIVLLFIWSGLSAQIKNFVFIGMDRDRLKDTSILGSPLFDGVQVAYSWRQLEPQKDLFDFRMIREDLALLKKYHKKLFIQLQDVSFSPKNIPAPAYLLNDPAYGGGVNKQYHFTNENETEFSEAGWAIRRWDTTVQKRLHKLYRELGEDFDGSIEGINTAETSVDFGKGPLHPPGFSFQRYMDATTENIAALKYAFPHSPVIVYANFMPGGLMPFEDSIYLSTIYHFAWKNNIGVGGPDLLPYKPGQMRNSYGFIRESYLKVWSGVSVQDGAQEYINPKTQQKITAAEIYQFGKDYLHLDYIFWGTEEPFFHSKVIPFLLSVKKEKAN